MEELVKRLRDAATMSEALAVLLPHSEGSAVAKLYNEAADTIEELSKQFDDMNEANIALYGALPKWIPVTERLPEKTGEYLVCGQWRGKPAETWVCELIAFGKIKGWANDARNPAVTHWMPLPEPPEEG